MVQTTLAASAVGWDILFCFYFSIFYFVPIILFSRNAWGVNVA